MDELRHVKHIVGLGVAPRLSPAVCLLLTGHDPDRRGEELSVVGLLKGVDHRPTLDVPERRCIVRSCGQLRGGEGVEPLPLTRIGVADLRGEVAR